MPPHTVQSLLQTSIVFLEEKGVSEARRSAELLLAHALGARRIDLYLRYEQPLRDDEIARFRELVRRRLRAEPVQYILGQAEFYGLPFQVSPAVLIPRPETEHLVERAIDLARAATAAREARAIDIGTGSGCIAVTLAKHVARLSVTALDVSEPALAVARANAEFHGVAARVECMLGDILAGEAAVFRGPFDLVCSNPPYIASAELASLQPEVRDHEPREALTDGGDGLAFFRRIARLAPAMLAPGGTCLLEIGYGQSDAVRRIFTDAGLGALEVIDDYAGIPRVVVARAG